MPAESYHFGLHGVLNITAGLFDLFLGLLVLSKDPKSPVNRSFFLVTLFAFIWVVPFGIMSLCPSESQARFWLAMAYTTGIPFISPVVHLFSVRFFSLGDKKKLVRWSFLLGAVFAFLFFLFQEKLGRFTENSWGRYIAYQGDVWGYSYFIPFIIFFYFFGFLAFRNFYRGWRGHYSLKIQHQSQIVFFGFFLAYTGSVDFFVKMGLKLYPFGYISLTLLIMTMAYGIIRHRLFNINLFLKKISLIALIYSFLALAIVPVSFFAFDKLGNSIQEKPWEIVVELSLVIGLIFSLGPFIYAYLVRNSYWLRSQMTSGLAHELKSPLGAIQGALDVLSSAVLNPKGNQAQVSEYLEMIQKNTERMEGAIQDLLNVARIQEGAAVAEKEEGDLNKVIEAVAEIYRPAAGQKNLEITTDIQPLPPVKFDRVKIEHVISNLISNAIKCSERGQIRICGEKLKGAIQISVQDEGKGIPERFHKKIFERFFQVEKQGKGSGIGLAIAKAWVELHGGKIWVESEGEGHGSKFFFTLPV